MKKIVQFAVLGAAVAVSTPSFGYDLSLSEDTYISVSGDARVAAAAGGDEEGLFARGTLTAVLRHVFSGDVQGGVLLTLAGQSDEDTDFDNRGDGPRGEVYRAYGFIETEWGSLVFGKTFGAVTELLDTAPSAIGNSYTVDTPFFMHVTRPRFAPRSPSMSPDFEERTERIAYYSPMGQPFQFGISYAPELQDDGLQGLTNIHSRDAIDIAAAYTHQFSDGLIRLSGGYAQADANVVTANTATAADQRHVSVALSIEYQGFVLGGGMHHTDNTLGLRNIDNLSYQFGAQYAVNDLTFSGSYGYAEDQYSRDLIANPILGGFGDASVEVIELAARYDLNQNWAVSLAGIQVDYQDEVLAPTAQNDGRYGVLQLHFGF